MIPTFECPLCGIEYQELIEMKDGEKVCLWDAMTLLGLPRRQDGQSEAGADSQSA